MKLKTKVKRWLFMRRHRSTVPTGLVPLSDMHSVVIYLDNADDLSEPHKTKIRRFYEDSGLSVRFLYADDESLRTESDLFICLSSEGGINERYAAGSSSARFKIGRHQLKRDVYDLVVTDNSPEPGPVLDAYQAIESYLLTIR